MLHQAEVLQFSPKQLELLPSGSGVYLMYGKEGQILYIGKAISLKSRVRSYFRGQRTPKTLRLAESIFAIGVLLTSSEYEALLTEQILIKTHRPKFNVLLKDDKSNYPYLYLSTHVPFAGAYMKRDPSFLRKKGDTKGRYMGPYSMAKLEGVLEVLQRAFGIRTCKDREFQSRSRPCLKYQIHRCSAPCVGYITDQAYQARLEDALCLVEGKSHQVLDRLQEEMLAAAKEEAFELAAKKRDILKVLEHYEERQQRAILESKDNVDVWGGARASDQLSIYLLMIRQGHISGYRTYRQPCFDLGDPMESVAGFVLQYYLSYLPKDEMVREVVIDLPELQADLVQKALAQHREGPVNLRLPKRGTRKRWLLQATKAAKVYLSASLNESQALVSALEWGAKLFDRPSMRRLACIDVSHLGGQETVASYVVSEEGELQPGLYRKFRLPGVPQADDYAAMREVIQRWVRHQNDKDEHFPAPDLLIIDGGKGQLSSVFEALKASDAPAVAVMGSAKGVTRKAGNESLFKMDYRPGEAMRIEEILTPHPAFAPLVWRIQSEAHRFAITYQRQVRTRVRVRSWLETMEGVGPKRREALIQHFGSLEGVKQADVQSLAQVVPEALAKKIYQTLRLKKQ